MWTSTSTTEMELKKRFIWPIEWWPAAFTSLKITSQEQATSTTSDTKKGSIMPLISHSTKDSMMTPSYIYLSRLLRKSWNSIDLRLSFCNAVLTVYLAIDLAALTSRSRDMGNALPTSSLSDSQCSWSAEGDIRSETYQGAGPMRLQSHWDSSCQTNCQTTNISSTSAPNINFICR